MSDDLTENVDRFIGGLTSDDQPAQRKRRRPAKEPDIEVEREDPEPREERDSDPEDDDPVAMLPAQLPKPAESHRSLGGMLSKYGIGDDPNFRVQLHRLLPKWLPGGIQGHGYLDEFVQPITEDYIASEYGGGTYEIRVLGPDPAKGPNAVRRYDSIKVEMAGPPNPDRLARSVRAKMDAAPTPVAAPVQMMPAPENPTLASAALKMAENVAEREREERRRVEDRASTSIEAAKQMYDPVVQAERRRADEVLAVERERLDAERKAFESRLQEEREERRRLEAKVEAMSTAPQVSVAEEIGKLIPMFKGDGEAAAAAQRAAESITKSILERHQIEIEALHKQHQTLLESIRASHVSEVSAMRDASRREIEAEREAGRIREQRHEEALRVEREERRRDMDTYKRTADERDTQWRDRMEQQEINLKTQWESRVETQKSNYESQLQWQRSEIEQLQARIRNFESQLADRGDLVKQLTGMRDLRSVARDALGIEEPSAPSAPGAGGGGIGLAGMDGQSWQEVIGQTVQNLPDILRAMNELSGAAQPPQQVQMQQPPQQQPQPGQVVQTPRGEMVVVQTATGLALAPKDQYEAYAQQQRVSGQQRGNPRPRGMLAKPKPKPSSGLPVPDMSVGLPKPRQWGEPVQPPMPDAPLVTPAPTPVPTAAKPAQQRPQKENAVDPRLQNMIAKEVAKRVHESIESGDEPEEFVQKMLGSGIPSLIIQTIAGMGDDEVLSAIKQVAPNSAGVTPAGARFVRASLAALRTAI